MAYNKAVNYLREKYGSVERASTSNDFNDKELAILVGQYFYSIYAKRELELKVKKMKI